MLKKKKTFFLNVKTQKKFQILRHFLQERLFNEIKTVFFLPNKYPKTAYSTLNPNIFLFFK